MELPQVSIYFKLSSEMLSRTSSHICGRWYLPMFLFRDGLFTLMYRASFMVLMRFWCSVPSKEKIVNSDSMTRDVEVIMYRGRGFQMFFKPLFKISCWLSNVSIITIHPVTFISIYDSTFFKDWIFILWSHEEVFECMTSFKMYFNPIFLARSLEAFTHPLMVRYNNVWFWSSGVARLWIVAVSLDFLQGWWLTLQLDSVECSVWIFAFS